MALVPQNSVTITGVATARTETVSSSQSNSSAALGLSVCLDTTGAALATEAGLIDPPLGEEIESQSTVSASEATTAPEVHVNRHYWCRK